MNLVGAGFDAGIHLGEFIERDMIAVRVSRDPRAAIVGAPQVFRLTREAEIAARPDRAAMHQFSARLHRRLSLGVRQGGKSLSVAVNGPLVVDDLEVMIQAALDGVGLAFALEEHVFHHLQSGALVRVLEDWCPPFAGYFPYYPSRRQQRAALAALI
jgi:DNA-binding transcriptional LysR family regulator